MKKNKIVASVIIVFVVISLGISILYGFGFNVKGTNTKKTADQLIQEYIKGKKAVVIDFYADWCPPCKAMEPIMKTLEAKYKDKVYIVKVDVDNPQNNNLNLKFGIVSIPTYILINRKGVVVDKLIGYQEMEVMENEFKKLF
ncbi:MAG: thioredoxin family protein [bacterium]